MKQRDIIPGIILLLLCLDAWLLLRAGLEWWYVNLDGTPDVRHVALADLNSDGHLDAFLSMGSLGDSYWQRDHVMFNDGNGRFTDSGQELGEWNSFSAATGDINRDGAIDVLVANYIGLIRYLNDGSGRFDAHTYGPVPLAVNAALADLNGNGSLDAFLTGCCDPMGKGEIKPRSEVWLNDGAGDLFEGGQYLDQARTNAVALGDLNGDGALDAFLASGRSYVALPDAPNRVWFNDGQGGFSDSGQQLGNSESMAVALGDLNGDGFLDAVVGNRGPDKVWFNDGQGNFSESEQRLGRNLTWSVYLADLDGDSDLDLFAGGETAGRAWFNDGSGQFEAGRQRIGYGRYNSVAMGDVNGDDLIDMFASSLDSYQVWRNDGNGRFTADSRTDYH